MASFNKVILIGNMTADPELKQYTNFTFCDYLKHRRIQAAEMLLEQPEYSITEVALQAGFPSISTFNRIFKEYKNCTPTEYRTMMTKRRQKF